MLKHLDNQYPNRGEEYRTLKFLWTKIILDDPVPKMVVKGTPLRRSKVPPHKSLIYQPEGIGLVIGNLTSQGSSNAYLNEFDRYLHFTLGLKHFVRYVDDVVNCTRQAVGKKCSDGFLSNCRGKKRSE